MAMLVPGLIACGMAFGVCLVLVGLTRALVKSESGGLWSVSVALGLGYILGHAWIRGWLRGQLPPFPPTDAYDWIALLVLIAMVIGVLERCWPAPLWARWENRVLITGLSLWLRLEPIRANVWSAAEAPWWFVGLGVGMLVIWGVVEAHAERLGRGVVLPLLVWTFATAACMQLCHSLRMTELALPLLGGLAALWIVSRWSRGLSLARGGVPVVIVVLAGLILFGRFYLYPELPLPTALGLAVAPLALWVDVIPPINRWKPLWSGAARIVALLIPLGVAVGFAVQEFLKAGVEGY